MPSLKFQNLPTSWLGSQIKKNFPFFLRPVAAARDDSRIFLKMEKISGNLFQNIPKFQFHSLHSRRVGLVGVRPLKKPPDRCSYLLKSGL